MDTAGISRWGETGRGIAGGRWILRFWGDEVVDGKYKVVVVSVF